MENHSPLQEVIDEIKSKGGDAIKYCYQCGKCDTVCPWNKVSKFSMRKLVREATFGLSEIEKEEIWRCTTCGKCPQRCPRDVKQIDDIVAMRRMAYGIRRFAGPVKPYRAVSAGLQARATPLTKTGRPGPHGPTDWASSPYAEGMEVLYFPCCYCSYDPRLKKVAQATAKILNKAGVSFGILGQGRTAAAKASARPATRSCSRSWPKRTSRPSSMHGVKTILVSSPHCYHTFKNEYSRNSRSTSRSFTSPSSCPSSSSRRDV
jgi:Fe-S oxidoreductase